jgi:uroporphyrinogen-III synthase
MTLKSLPRCVLNTRSLEDAAELNEQLLQLGMTVVSEPLLQISFFDESPPDLEKFEALIFTSRNGLRAFGRVSAQRDIPVFAVGNSTARFAQEVGFQQVLSADGDVESLAALIVGAIEPLSGPLLHVVGSVTAGDLSGELQRLGYQIVRDVMYESRMSEKLSTRTIQMIRNGAVDSVALFSPRTARTFAKLAEHSGIFERCRDMSVMCLSPAVAVPVNGIPWRQVLIASQPKFEALMKLFGELEVDNGTS